MRTTSVENENARLVLVELSTSGQELVLVRPTHGALIRDP